MSGISLRCIYPFCQSTSCLLQLLTDILFPHHRTTLFQTIAESKGIEPLYRINDSPSLAGLHITTLSTLLFIFCSRQQKLRSSSLRRTLVLHIANHVFQYTAERKRFEL